MSLAVFESLEEFNDFISINKRGVYCAEET